MAQQMIVAEQRGDNVLAHEVGHLLLDHQHSPTGIMRGRAFLYGAGSKKTPLRTALLPPVRVTPIVTWPLIRQTV